MKTKFGIFAAVALMVFGACNKNDELSTQTLEGTYVGTLTNLDELKSFHLDTKATVEIELIDSSSIEVHCYGGEFDTVFMLNYFDHNDSVLVCLSGEYFEEMYGHQNGMGHGMGGGMMGNHQDGDTDWGHHMNDEHDEGDEHFGGFSKMNHSFDYSFYMHESDSSYYLHFYGTKQ